MLLAVCAECGCEWWDYGQEIQEWVTTTSGYYKTSCPKCGCRFIPISAGWEKIR